MTSKTNQKVLKWDLLKTAIVNQMIIVMVIFLTLGLLLSSFLIGEIRKNSSNIVKAIELNIKENFQRSTQNLDEIYHLYDESISGKMNNEGSVFNIFRNSDNSIDSIMILNGSGVLVDGSTESKVLKGTDFSTQSFVKNIPKVGDVYWTGVTVLEKSARPVAYVSKRYEHYIVVIRLNLQNVSDYISQFKLSKGSEVVVTDENGIYLISANKELVKNKSYDDYVRQQKSSLLTTYNGRYYLPYVSRLTGQGWLIIVYQSLEEFFLPSILLLCAFLLLSMIFIALINGLNYRGFSNITEDINQLERQALAISEGDYEYQPTNSRYFEINMLNQAFMTLIEKLKNREADIEQKKAYIMGLNEGLEKQVKQRTRQIEEANKELTEAYENLKEAQGLIVQNEKLAALGQMVSGVAHELNTPIGNAYTAATFLKRMAKDLSGRVLENKIKKSEFVEMVNEVDTGADIVARNLQVAGDLILNFKQISADHQNMEWRVFNLHETLKNIVISFGIDLRNSQIEVNLTCKEDLMLKSYPGAMVHIVSNLIRNALVHGFEGRDNGIIRIEAMEFYDMVTLIIEDNGIGMSDLTLSKIYDPFFTTKRSRGGTGLGLNIVHNMVTNVLEGTIICESTVGKGTRFKIQIPKAVAREQIDKTWE